MTSTSRSRSGIFISYRRSDSGPWTGRLADDLRAYFGADRIYRDCDSNRSAQDYVQQIGEALGSSRVVIAVLGNQWLDAVDGTGRRRLEDPNDLVRLELESALASGIALVPVVVAGAVMPREGQLPAGVQSLARLHAVRLADEDWHYDFGRLLETLERHGVVPSYDVRTGDEIDFKRSISTTRKYERTVQASRRRALDAVIGAVELLKYPQIDLSHEAAQITFTAIGRQVTTAVVDAGAGRSTVVVSFASTKTGLLAAGAAVAVMAMANPLLGLGWPALRAWERRFAKGFLDNVQRVLEGRDLGENSALPPGLEAWRNRKREV